MILDFNTIRSITCGARYLEKTENGIRFHRMTEEEENFYNRFEDPVIALRWLKKAKSNSGIALKFETDSPTLSLRAMIEWSSIRSFYCLEFFVNGKRVDTLQNFREDTLPEMYSEIKLPPRNGLILEKEIFLGEGKKEVEILLPWNHSVLLQEIKLAPSSLIQPKKDRGILLAYGDSITHGADALYPSSKYITRLARALGLEERNKAVSAEVFRSKLAELAEEMDPTLITVAYGTNDWSSRTFDVAKKEAALFLQTLKKRYPTSPIAVLSPIWRANLPKDTAFGSFDLVETMLSEICRELGLSFISCRHFVPEEKGMFADLRLHPNDRGFEFYFEGLLQKIKELNLC